MFPPKRKQCDQSLVDIPRFWALISKLHMAYHEDMAFQNHGIESNLDPIPMFSWRFCHWTLSWQCSVMFWVFISSWCWRCSRMMSSWYGRNGIFLTKLAHLSIPNWRRRNEGRSFAIGVVFWGNFDRTNMLAGEIRVSSRWSSLLACSNSQRDSRKPFF